jgi:glycosyl transferase family 25
MIILLLIVLIIIYLFNYEKFTEIDESGYIDYNVIHVKNSCNKKRENINKQMKKLGKKINIFDAINGKDIDIDNLDKFDKNIKLNYKFETNNELGCYLSHLMLIKKAINSDKKYTVIFEDDFNIVTKDLNKEILDITKKVDDNFDIIYLGNMYESKSEKIVDNIYKKHNIIRLLGTHALLINNKNALSIYKNILNINHAIDQVLEKLINENKLNVYVIYPSLVFQNAKFNSSLRPYYKIIARQVIVNIVQLFNKLTD